MLYMISLEYFYIIIIVVLSLYICFSYTALLRVTYMAIITNTINSTPKIIAIKYTNALYSLSMLIYIAYFIYRPIGNSYVWPYTSFVLSIIIIIVPFFMKDCSISESLEMDKLILPLQFKQAK